MTSHCRLAKDKIYARIKMITFTKMTGKLIIGATLYTKNSAKKAMLIRIFGFLV